MSRGDNRPTDEPPAAPPGPAPGLDEGQPESGHPGPRVSFRLVAAGVAALVIIGIAAGFEPITRNVAASQSVCFGCHPAGDYVPGPAGSSTAAHPATPQGGTARCVDCHVPPGWSESLYVYTHYVAGSDLFGQFVDRRAGRTGPAAIAAVARAYRVQARLLENDSVTCRTCHIESEIKPQRKRGQNAHRNALKNKDTCVSCHDTLGHREVPEPA